MADACDITLTIDDFQAVSDSTPYLCDLKPSGKYVFQDLHTIGGIPHPSQMAHRRRRRQRRPSHRHGQNTQRERRCGAGLPQRSENRAPLL